MGSGQVAMTAPVSIDRPIATAEVEKPLTTEDKVNVYFADLPILIDIANCESRFRQTDKAGNIFRGVANRYDVGVMQINELYHGDEAKKLGLNIYTLDGNMEYARHLYEREGARPWLSSSACWAHYSNIAKS
jgi:hypothetical protein